MSPSRPRGNLPDVTAQSRHRPPSQPARLVPLVAGAGLTLLCATSPVAQTAGEMVHAYLLDVRSDLFQCGQGQGACNLSYRIYHASGTVEVNRPPSTLDGSPRYRPKRGVYETDATQTGNFPSVRGLYGVPFFVAWDGVIDPGSASHVGYYGVQSQIVNHGETGNSSRVNCASGQRPEACFEPLSSFTSGHTLRSGRQPIGGLSPIPVPQVVRQDEERIALEWDQARGYVVTDGAPPGILGYQLYAFPGANPSNSALAGGGRLVGEFSLAATRAEVRTSHPALAQASQVTFALKLVYVGNLVSRYFSANSDPVAVGEQDGDEEEAADGDEDGVPDREDNCPAEFNPDQFDEDGDGRGDLCDPTPSGEEPEPPDESSSRDPERAHRPPEGPPATPQPGSPPSAGRGLSAAADDGDGIAAATDNCPGLYNPQQGDADGDGRGDACDADADGDGVPDHRDCAANDPLAALDVAVPPDLVLRVEGPVSTRVTWLPAAGGPYQLLRGSLPLAGDAPYDHTCALGGIREDGADDAESPEGAGFYYLIAPDSGCGPAWPGAASDGRPRPPGSRCLRARVAAVAPSAENRPAGIWRLDALGGPVDELEISISLSPPAGVSDLYAVSFDLVYDPGQVSPVGLPRPGPLLAEESAPARIDFDDSAAVQGRLTYTVSRTGLAGGLASGTAGGVLLRTRWRALGRASGAVWVENVKALNSSYESLSLAPPSTWYHLAIGPAAEASRPQANAAASEQQ